jgi:ATP-dependent Clp protease ATP-binding subunit ClpB
LANLLKYIKCLTDEEKIGKENKYMNFNNFTIKSQEAVQEAVNSVQSHGQQAIEPVHLLAGVMKVGENVTNFIFQKLGMGSK